jgi:hypothetical protein
MSAFDTAFLLLKENIFVMQILSHNLPFASLTLCHFTLPTLCPAWRTKEELTTKLIERNYRTELLNYNLQRHAGI